MSANLDSDLDASKPLKNARHEAFAQAVADGNAEADAYKKVYGVKADVARRSASRLLTNVLVRARVDWLKEQNAKVKALTRERKREILAKIAEDGAILSKDPRAVIAAIQEDNRMTGDCEENLNVKGGFCLSWGKAKNV